MATKCISLFIICIIISLSSFAQNISLVNPNNANPGDMLTVSISGQNTHFTQGSLTVWFNQGSSTINPYFFFPISNTLIEADFYFPHFTNPGYWDVNIDNTVDGHLIKSKGFLINSNYAQITSIVPNKANLGQTLDVSISGQNTHFAQGSETIWFNQGSSTIYPITYTVLLNTLLSAHFYIPSNANTGFWEVNVKNPTDGHLEKFNGFLINSNIVQLINVVPDNANLGQTLDVSISGKNTHFTQGSETIWFSQGSSTLIPITYTVSNNTLLKANFSIPLYSNTGYWDVNVKNFKDGHLEKFNGFLINSNIGQITYVVPDNANLGQTLDVYISGQNTHFTQGSETIWFSQGTSTLIPNTYTVSNNTLLKANFSIPSNANTGDWDVNVNNSTDGHLTKYNGFHVNLKQPPIININPNKSYRGEKLNVSISGQYTHFAQGSITVWFNQGSSTIFPNTHNVINNTLLDAEFSIPSSAALGYWDVNVDNFTDGHLKKIDGFYIGPNLSEITSINPDSAYQGDTLSFLLTASNTQFSQGITTLWLEKVGVTINPITTNVFSTTSISASITIPSTASIGDWDVYLFDTPDTLVLINGFKIIKGTGLVDQSENQFRIETYPNPCDGILYLRAKLNKPSTLNISVINLVGEKVLAFEAENVSSVTREIDLSHLPNGMYFLLVKGSDQEYMSKIIKTDIK